MRRKKDSLLRRGRDGEKGQALYLVAGLLFFFLAAAAFVVDMGHIMHAQRELQASADAAATAGGADLPNGTLAVQDANLFSATPGNKNAFADLPNVTMASGYPKLLCLNTLINTEGMACATTVQGGFAANAIQVQEQVNLPLYFAKIFGISTVQLTATATSSARGGQPHPNNVVIISQATGQTQNADPNCPGTGITGRTPSQLDCIKSGVRTLLLQLWPCPPSQGNCGGATNGNVANPVDEVSLMVFPGLLSSTYAQGVAYEYTGCQATQIGPYIDYNYTSSPLPVYTIVPFSSDYRTSDTSGLNGSVSHLVQAVDWQDGVGCTENAYGYQQLWETDYAGAITAAQAALQQLQQNNPSRSNIQNAIILVSDGNASGQPGCGAQGTCNGGGPNQCAQAVTAAQAAAAAGTWVYSVAYNASTQGAANGYCNTDASGISPCSAMQQIASDPSKFYSDDGLGCASTAHPSVTALNDVFTSIGNDLHTTGLIPNNTQ